MFLHSSLAVHTYKVYHTLIGHQVTQVEDISWTQLIGFFKFAIFGIKIALLVIKLGLYQMLTP